MLIAAVILSAMSLATGAAALTLAVLAWNRPSREKAIVPPDEGTQEGKPFKLDDRKIQEGISNLLAYEAGQREEEQ